MNFILMKTVRGGLAPLAALAGLLVGCATSPAKLALDAPQQDVGYSLLAKLLHDERRLKQIFLLKEAPEPTRKLVEEISTMAGTAEKKLAALSKQAPPVRLNVNGLPPVERKTRLTLEELSTKEFLESEGKSFESTVLLSQTEALNYGIGLTQVLAEGERNSARRKFLQDLSKKCVDLRAEVINRLLQL
jgi:hypothetical protein